ncbi:cystinosin [Diabrotica undecimpunctata]|uniref:cystinosin n=1 Tax=Diabrotica undecimpunctata TaxID=50387 RepID=UPI003B637047
MEVLSSSKLALTILSVLCLCQHTLSKISVSTHDARIKLHDTFLIEITLPAADIKNNDETISLISQHTDIITPNISEIVIKNIKEDETVPVNIITSRAGHSDLYANASSNETDVSDVFVRFTVYKKDGLDTFSAVIGWIYFVAWSVSFYPQIYINWKRKSVVGLNFDFIALNVVGFSLYSLFNLGLYYIPEIRDEYAHRYPRGLNPVKVNDIVFAVHAFIATILTIIQCFIYEREDQRVSTTARGILGIFGVFILISIILSACNVIHWLDLLYYCSYVKLTITLIKYIPQAYMNYKRKSTIGWSIGNIFLDFTGGTLSMLQMMVDAYNYDDWVSIFGDPTKFGLGLFSVIFDIFFIVQHYILYRHSRYDVDLP